MTKRIILSVVIACAGLAAAAQDFNKVKLDSVFTALEETLNQTQLDEYYEDASRIKQSHDYTLLSLGIAQHYGLPSVGLDLTKTIEVAAWFASHKVNIGEDGKTTIAPISDFSQSTIFIFRCPKDAVYSYGLRKPKFIQDTRPDRQDAWFGHVGWGCAKNELASFLVCAIRLDGSILSLLEKEYSRFLFPERSTDLMLNYFLDVRENPKYKGETRRALDRIYTL